MNRQQWLKERLSGVGASEASAIVNLNPYKTNVELWEEKTGLRVAEDISDKAVVKYGIEAERPLRELFALDFPQYQVEYHEYKIIRNAEYPFIFCTLDGELTEIETGRKGILEIKTTEIMQSGQWAKWKDRIPDNYYIQCLHQLLATGWDFVILKAQIKSTYDNDMKLTTKHYPIERKDVLEDIEYLKNKEIEFWNNNVLTKEKPNLLLPLI